VTGPQQPQQLPSVRIPADVDREDSLIGQLNARQVTILAITGVTVWVAYLAAGQVVPLLVFAVFAIPVATAGVVLALGRRDGLSADRLVWAAIGFHRSPRRLVLAPEGVHPAPAWALSVTQAPGRTGKTGQAERLPAPLHLPAEMIGADGVVDLAGGGLAVLAEASTVSFALRAPHEQQALVEVFARWLNSLTGPVQILIRSQWVDLSPMIARLRDTAPALPHPALEQAAHDHAGFLAGLAEQTDLTRRQVVLIFTDPQPGKDRPLAAERLTRSADTAARALAVAGIGVRVLDGGQAAALLHTAGNPLGLPQASDGWAAPGQIILGPGISTASPFGRG
jgi:hypothetical protein